MADGFVPDARSSPEQPEVSATAYSHDDLLCAYNSCVRAYVVRAGINTDWALVARSSAAMLLLSRQRRPRREWVRFILRSRENLGEYHHLVRDMRLDDGRDFFMYFRMTRKRFEHLLSLVGPLLLKQATFWSTPIAPAERLSLTIRYLAHGASQAICSTSYRIGRSTTSGIIRETCLALHKVLDPLYRPASEETLEAIVWACVNLHNYLRVCDESEQGERRYCPVGYADQEAASGAVTGGQWRSDAAGSTALSDVGRVSSNNASDTNKAVRDKFMRYFCSSQGEVPWQYNVVFKGSAPES
ncbi:hypothetical protein HPB47_018798 [Ixodes persulcatus]|uniref:Uncharacterized protein n=1 Tax=Ixodes persulcatus TaxID=34615 RepID=A0AC60QJW4_IXOPE|nr:hypothetical protein HPB47_018798 [Ixodes persulcatus]